jgi:hypothetical protein
MASNNAPPGFPKFDPVDIIGEQLAAQYPNLDLSKLNRMFTNILTELQDSQSAAATAQTTANTASATMGAKTGTHAQRIGLPVPDNGTIFVETDRNDVAYQVQGGVWRYVLGEMFGVLSGRPTDLGANDEGFLYSASNALDYRWSGTAWVSLDTVRGGTALVDVGRLIKVGATGTLGETAFADSAVVLGATNLTHANHLLKVDGSSGTATESVVTDDGTTVVINKNTVAPAAAAAGTILQLAGADAAAARALIDAYGGFVTISGRRANGTAAAPSALAALDVIAGYQARGYGATGYSATSRAQMALAAAEAWSDTAQGTRIDFYTTLNGTVTTILRMTIADDGKVGVNCVPAYQFDVGGGINTSTEYRLGGTVVIASTEAANTFLRGPTSGAAALPSFGALVSADIPNNAADTSGTSGNTTKVNGASVPASAGFLGSNGSSQLVSVSSPTILTGQSVVTGSRNLTSIYQNTGAKPIYVLVTLACTAAGGANFGQAEARTDASATPTTTVGSTFNGSATATVNQQMAFWVLPGNYYRVVVVTTTVTLSCWTEWS